MGGRVYKLLGELLLSKITYLQHLRVTDMYLYCTQVSWQSKLCMADYA